MDRQSALESVARQGFLREHLYLFFWWTGESNLFWQKWWYLFFVAGQLVFVCSSSGRECNYQSYVHKNSKLRDVCCLLSKFRVFSVKPEKVWKKSRLSIESTVGSIPPMETTSFPYRANVREKKNIHVPLEGARPEGREKRLAVNDLINAHSQINASYLIKASLRTLSSLY